MLRNEILRLWHALGHSWEGIRAALKSEPAFRIEAAAACAMLPLTLMLHVTAAERSLLMASVLLVLIVELLNTALEKTLDRLAPELHPLTKYAKDAGSAAVLLALLLAALVWGGLLL